MSAPSSKKTARRPLSYDRGACEGWQASPSTPTRTTVAPGTKERLERTVVLRCTAAEKARVIAAAKEAGASVSALLREALGLVRARRRKPVPRVDPALVVAVARIGGNLNQIARQLNRQAVDGRERIDAMAVAAQLVAIERQLSRLSSPTAKVSPAPQKEQAPC